MQPKINISLTSYPARIGVVAKALQPILRQTVTPDRILVWLSKDEFPSLDASLPQDLIELRTANSKLQICWVDGNHFSHDKYLGCLQQFPDDITILIDDDLVYPTTLVQQLLDFHFLFPESIIANRTHLVTQKEPGEIAPYTEWAHEQTEFVGVPRNDLIATTGAGTLYPPRAFNEIAFDVDAIRELACTADDIWLMMCTIEAKRTVVAIGNSHLSYIDGTQENGLCKLNWDQGQNDVQLKNLFARYPDFQKRLIGATTRKVVVSEENSTPQSRKRFFRRH